MEGVKEPVRTGGHGHQQGRGALSTVGTPEQHNRGMGSLSKPPEGGFCRSPSQRLSP